MVEEVLFSDESVAKVVGVRLQDGRRIVVKLHSPEVEEEFLRAVQRTQRHLASRGFPAAHPVAGPVRAGRVLVTAEALLDEGVAPDGHDPAVRAEMASGLARQVEMCRGLKGVEALARNPARALASDLADPAARRAREILDRSAGEVVVGHTDWRAQNMRFAAGRLSAVYDWESLDLIAEPVLVGGNAYIFTADWSAGQATFPGVEEALAFVADYERARGRPFSEDERAGARAGLACCAAFVARTGAAPLLPEFAELVAS